MKSNGIINPLLIAEIARLGHTDYLVIADAGLPIPQSVTTIDISLVNSIPSFISTLKAVKGELVIERCILAEEIRDNNTALFSEICAEMPKLPIDYVTHSDFKNLLVKAKAIIRTGEASPYANCILVGGVNF